MHVLILAADGSAPLETTATLIGVITGVGAILTGIGLTVRKTAVFLIRVGHFLDDWNGEAERPGHPERPGVLKRLDKVEVATANNALAVGALTEQLALIANAVGELQPNGGSTLWDAIHRIEGDTAQQVARPIPPTAPSTHSHGGTS